MDGNGVNTVYFSVLSLYIIGYGDFSFKATPGKLFALFWLPLGTLIVCRAASYLRAQRHRICVVCVRKNMNTKSTVEAQPKIASGHQFENGTHVETR
ncbi:putative potassium channel domain-containing protein [Rosa chinensis]|uniref:Putative potassium channel domain-containing protein n=1 Tax=Rosa chinensis TaxID=74649 RepID=A0A2P6RB64_ROSCH|nr:putative potassium channel domain-containing protein [Rosa chinensis]